MFGARGEENAARLIAAVLRVDPGSGAVQRAVHPNSAWRQSLAALRRVAVIVPVISVMLLAVVAYALLQFLPGRPVTVTGSVICESGQPLIAVWIAASSGQVDSGYAHLGPVDTKGTSFPDGAEGTYSYRLPHGGSYAVHVGCGGTTSDWASSNYSPLLSSNTARLRCGRPVPTGSSVPPKGRCVLATEP